MCFEKCVLSAFVIEREREKLYLDLLSRLVERKKDSVNRAKNLRTIVFEVLI